MNPHTLGTNAMAGRDSSGGQTPEVSRPDLRATDTGRELEGAEGARVIRLADSDADLQGWVDVWNAITPREPTSVEFVRDRLTRQPERLYLVAENGGVVVGAGLSAPSDTPGRRFIGVRVLPAHRGRGLGRALYDRLEAHALALRPASLSTQVAEDAASGRPFAESRGYVEGGRQVELVRELEGDEQPPEPMPGIDVAELTENLREDAYEVTKQAWADMPLPDEVPAPSWDDWVRDEISGPVVFAALEEGRLVGYAALLARPAPGLVEHGLTACLRTHRGRGIGTLLKRTQIAWAAQNGYRQLITWTQEGNEAMRRVNEKLGYVEQPAWLTMRRELP
jgi:mycothiol synthase